MEKKKLTEEEIDRMSIEELREYLDLGKPIPKAAWKHPEMSAGQLVEFYRKKDESNGG